MPYRFTLSQHGVEFFAAWMARREFDLNRDGPPLLATFTDASADAVMQRRAEILVDAWAGIGAPPAERFRRTVLSA